MKKFIVFDTECIGLENRSVYDIAWVVTDRNGHIYKAENFLVEEVITDAKLMNGAHYHAKVYSDYIPMLNAGDITLAAWQDIIDLFRSDIQDVYAIAAYNMQFDIDAMSETHNRFGDGERITDGKRAALCIWQFVCEAILSRNKFQQVATENGWFKNSTGNVYTNAEKAYAYITGAHGFVEDHTALSDVMIETEILAACFKQKQTIPYNIVGGSPWKLAQ